MFFLGPKSFEPPNSGREKSKEMRFFAQKRCVKGYFLGVGFKHPDFPPKKLTGAISWDQVSSPSLLAALSGGDLSLQDGQVNKSLVNGVMGPYSYKWLVGVHLRHWCCFRGCEFC